MWIQGLTPERSLFTRDWTMFSNNANHSRLDSQHFIFIFIYFLLLGGGYEHLMSTKILILVLMNKIFI